MADVIEVTVEPKVPPHFGSPPGKAVVCWATIPEAVYQNTMWIGPDPLTHIATWVKRMGSDYKRRANCVENAMRSSSCAPCVRKVLDEAIEGWWVQGNQGVALAFLLTDFHAINVNPDTIEPVTIISPVNKEPNLEQVLRGIFGDTPFTIS